MRAALWAGRAFLLLTVVMAGTVLLMRMAPGYLSDQAEMDAQHGGQARARMQMQGEGNWLAQNLTVSRQFELPVWQLIKPRLSVTFSLLLRSVLLGWLVAFSAVCFRRLSELRLRGAMALPFTLLLAVPVGALATVCLQMERLGPLLVLTLILSARDFKFLDRLILAALDNPCFLQAKAQGLRVDRVVKVHLLAAVGPQLLALAVMSIVTALSALVPVEVLFDSPGLGQLAWTAAMNRDIPVLLAVTLIFAAVVAVLSAFAGCEASEEPA